MYYLARERAKTQRDMITIIIDSYDHAKMSLPKWPMMRTPKRSLFENTRRHPIALCHMKVCGFMIVYVMFFCVPQFSRWESVPILLCLIFKKPRYLSHLDRLHRPWRWCVFFPSWWRNGWWIKLDNRMCISVKLLNTQVSLWTFVANISLCFPSNATRCPFQCQVPSRAKVMKSIDHAWRKLRSLNQELPRELLGKLGPCLRCMIRPWNTSDQYKLTII